MQFHVSPFLHKKQRPADWKRDNPAEVSVPVLESRKQDSSKQIKNLPKAKDQKTTLPENSCSGTPTTWTSGSKVVTGNYHDSHSAAKSQRHPSHPSKLVTSLAGSSCLHIQQLTKLVIIRWANELKSLDYLLGCGKFSGESQIKLDNILSQLEANQDHPHWTKKLLRENELHAKIHKVWTSPEYCKKSRKRAGKIYSLWWKRQMVDSPV